MTNCWSTASEIVTEVLASGGIFASGGASVSVTDIITILSVVVTILMSTFAFLLNRKNTAEKELRKLELDSLKAGIAQAKEDTDKVKQQLEYKLNQANRELSSLRRKLEEKLDESADFDTVKEFGQDVKELQHDMLAHQARCGDRFVHRSAYTEDIKAQRETLNFIRDTIKQYSEIIARLVS